MEWLSQNWIWLALGIGVILLMRRGGLGCCAVGHQARDHGGMDGRKAGEDVSGPAAPASVVGRPGTAGMTDGAASGTEAMAVPPQGAPKAHRHHGCC